jgi:murein DD-endopeptidase MepM/ murein hydrolase activator NlpD
LASIGLAAAGLFPPAADLAAADATSQTAESTKVAALSSATIGRTLQVRKGDTLMKLLIDAGIARPEAHAAIAALTQVYSPRDLRPGQSIELLLSAPDESDGLRLASLSLQPDLERDIRVERRRADDRFSATAIDRPLSRELTAVAGVIESSLFLAGKRVDVPIGTLTELIRIFSFDVDFQREIQAGDRFALIYESYYDPWGRLAKTGPLLYAKLVMSGKPLEVYRYTPASGITDYFAPKGKSVRKALLRTPVDGARLSSGFGMRRHPVQGYSKMHRGADFAAPRGTPVYAAGAGVVELAGRRGSYGKYVRIKHNGTYQTAYAHMHRIAKGLRPGKRVSQGQVIGQVGSTGRSTGPHLHYEVLRGGKQVNPLKIKLPSGEQLKGDDLARFGLARTDLDHSREVLLGGLEVAHSACGLLSKAEAALADRESGFAGPRC